MLEQTNGSSFFLRKSKNPQDKLFYVYQRVTVNGHPKEWSIKRKWDPERWSQKFGRASDNREDAKILNDYLDTLSARVIRAQKTLTDNDKEITGSTLEKEAKGIAEPSKMLIEEFEIHNVEMVSMIGLDEGYAQGTYDRFVTALSHTKDFVKFKYGQNDISLKALDYDFIKSYYHWLRTIRKCSHNTSVKYLTNMKKVVLHYAKTLYLKGDPFIAFPLTVVVIEKPKLTVEEVNRIIDKKFDTFRLSFTRDMFILSCFTGLAYSDVRKLKYSDIVRVDGMYWISQPRTKTKVESNIPILEQAQAIFNRYRVEGQTGPDDKLVAIKSNKSTNEYLKEIAVLCKISKNLTFHTARHTFASTVTLNFGVAKSAVQHMLGHATQRQTDHYAKVEISMVADQMKSARKKIKAKFSPIIE